MTIPTITTLIDPPLPTDAPAIFDQKAFAAWASLNTWAGEVNDVATQVNIDADRVNDPAVQTVAANLTSIVAVANNKTNIDRVSANQANINVVSANDTNIRTVSGISSQVTTVAGMKPTVEAVDANKANINNVAGNKVNIDNVAGNRTNINTVAGNSANVTTVATNISSVNIAAGNISAVIDAPTQATKAQTQATLADGYRQQAAASSTTATAAATAASSSASLAQTAAATAQAIVWQGTTGYPKIRPSLLLDFANSKTVDPRITFTRASTASYWDDKGVLRQALAGQPRIDHDPATGECKGLLIEESRTNLVRYSENISNVTWFSTQAHISFSSVVSPNASLNSRKIVESASSAEHYISSQNISNLPAGIYTTSVFAHSSSERNLYIRPVHIGETAATSQVVFTPSTGALSAVGGQGLSAGARYVGNGWWRVWFVFEIKSTRDVQLRLQVYTNTPLYQGDGVSGVVVFGAQLEAGSFPTTYIPTPAAFTSRASVGTYTDSTGVLRTAAIDEARYDHGLVDGVWVPKGLLLERQSTNLLTYSEQFDNAAWGKNRTTVVANAATAPDGELSADKIVENNDVAVTHSVVGTYMVGVGKEYTFSVIVKPAERSCISLQSGAENSFGQLIRYKFDLNNLNYVAEFGTAKAKIEPLGSGWARCSISATATSTVGAGFNIYLNNGAGATYNGDGVSGVYLWAAQLEEIPAGQSPEPSSYIKTEATAVTRSADVSTSSAVTRAADSAVMTGENFSSWYNRSEGTIFVEAAIPYVAAANRGPIRLDDVTDNNRIMIRASGAGLLDGRVITNGSSVANMDAGNTLTAGKFFNAALSYKNNDFAMSFNGAAPNTDSSGNVPSVSRLLIGDGLNSTVVSGSVIQRITYYPKRLADNELQALTAE